MRQAMAQVISWEYLPKKHNETLPGTTDHSIAHSERSSPEGRKEEGRSVPLWEYHTETTTLTFTRMQLTFGSGLEFIPGPLQLDNMAAKPLCI